MIVYRGSGDKEREQERDRRLMRQKREKGMISDMCMKVIMDATTVVSFDQIKQGKQR